MGTLPSGKSFDARKPLRPTESNRSEAVERIIWGLRQRAVDTDALQRAEVDLRAAIASGKGLNFFWLLRIGLEKAIAAVLAVESDPARAWREFALAVSYAQYAVALRKLASGVADTDPMSYGDQALHLCFLAIGRSPGSAALPMAARLNGLFANEGIRDDIGDDAVFGFSRFLLHSYSLGSWPQNASEPQLPDPYSELIQSLGEASTAQRAIVRYCDWRLSRAYGFADSLSAKPDSVVKYGYFIRQWFAICPFELLALQSVYFRLTGRSFSLDVDHPLLQTPLANPPALEVGASDALLMEVGAAALSLFGDSWQPEAVVPLDSGFNGRSV